MVSEKKPVKKENPKPEVKKVVKVVKESKVDSFNRLAKVRVEKVLKAIRILGNCSNRSNYDYSKEQIDKIDFTLTTALGNMLAKFTQSKAEQESFEF